MLSKIMRIFRNSKCPRSISLCIYDGYFFQFHNHIYFHKRSYEERQFELEKALSILFTLILEFVCKLCNVLRVFLQGKFCEECFP